MEATASYLIKQGQVGLLLQAGGDGTRMGKFGKMALKPLTLLADCTTCLDNILYETPETVPVFMHIKKTQKPKYQEYFREHGHENPIHYLFQRHSVIQHEDGRLTPFTVHNGPGSFGKALKRTVEDENLDLKYFATYDACKTGIDFLDVAAAITVMMKDGREALCFTEKPSMKKITSDFALLLKKGSYPRYDRLKNGRVYEKRNLGFRELFYPTLTGLNVFNYPCFAERVEELQGKEVPITFYYLDYRITDVLSLFDKVAEADQKKYFMSIKVTEDLNKYARSVGLHAV